MLKRDDVLISLFNSTPGGCCAEAWKKGFAFFGCAGRVFFCLGNGKHPDDWFDAGLEVKELKR